MRLVAEPLERRQLLTTQFVGDPVSVLDSATAQGTWVELTERPVGGFTAVWHQEGRTTALHRQFDWPAVATVSGPAAAVAPIESRAAYGGDHIASDDQGNYVIAWGARPLNSNNDRIYARRFRATGEPLSGPFVVREPTDMADQAPSVAMAGDGRFVIAWQGGGSGAYAIHVQRYGADGTPVGGPIRVSDVSSLFGAEFPDVAMADDGTITVVWSQPRSGSFGSRDVRAQRVAWDGTLAGQSYAVSTADGGRSATDGGAVAATPDGRVVVAWSSAAGGVTGDEIFMRGYDAGGAPVGDPVLVVDPAETIDYAPVVDVNDAGDVVVAWTARDASQWGVFARRMRVEGQPISAEFRVNRFETWDQVAQTVLVDGDRFTVGWSGYFPGIPQPVIRTGVQPLDDSGTAQPIEITGTSFLMETVSSTQNNGTTSDIHRFQFDIGFSAALGNSSLQRADFRLRNLTTGAVLPLSAVSASAAVDRKSVHVTATPGSVSPDGLWRLELDRRDVGDAMGTPLAASLAYEFVAAAGTTGADVIRVRRNGDQLDVFDNSDAPAFSAPFADALAIAVHGGSGDDRIELDASMGDVFAPQQTRLNGGNGTDVIALVGDGGADGGFSVTPALISHALGTASIAAAERFELKAGQYAFPVNAISFGIDVGVDALATFEVSQRLSSLTIASGGQATLSRRSGGDGGSRVLMVGSLSIAAGAALDLADNSLIVDYHGSSSPAGEIAAMIRTAYNGGNWLGSGIRSSAAADDPQGVTALGYADNATLGFNQFAGVTGLTGNEILVKYTYYGDADLSGAVSLDDFTLFLGGYQSGKTTWTAGDFDHTASVSLDDFAQFLAGYQRQGPKL